ncbi:iron complex transport system permease protein [Kineosphaera limosa]|uniref:Putative iron-siderophore ABC transporter permease protein n=1 Tax=Kineosphaera limosa NBRC 100340 TaxID=1184609 RepID=K6X806_9MICO|nr:iron ABC transporter permease [Kineosphaera limosa]NYE00866.1 iron complex transport system permease protein [Kineosphaera limosa]GAB94939.1 putative iron-siderophore ABC transporter permease protein [Kineosphaera limosa NBRC 100340]
MTPPTLTSALDSRGGAPAPDDGAPAGRRRRTPLARRRIGCTVAAVVALAVGVVLDLCLGDTWIPPADVVGVLLGTGDDAALDFLVRELRGPRVVGALLVGACLGMSGSITQSLLRNPLASPDIIGVTAGASCLAVVSLLAASSASSFAPETGTVTVPVLAVAGGALAGLLVVAVSWRNGLDARRVILVGLGVNAGLSAFTSWLLLRADLPDLTSAMIWLTGSLSAVEMGTLRPALVGALLCLLLAGITSRYLGLLRFGELTVRSLGVNVALAQLGQAAIAVVAASLACAIAGPVAFVAFCAPQIAMFLFRTEGPPVAGGALIGAVMVVVADVVARTAFPAPVPVGLVTSFAGAPVLLWLLTRYAGRDA